MHILLVSWGTNMLTSDVDAANFGTGHNYLDDSAMYPKM